MSPIRQTVMPQPTVAYFSMEIGLDPSIPTYSGGLGVLAGDTLRAAADLGLPMVGVTLLYRQGYIQQHLDAQGNQTESPVPWSPQDHLEPLPQRVTVEIEGRRVQLRPWVYKVRGSSDHEVPVYFLDARLPDNDSRDQSLTDHLYGGDQRYRLCQEAILGLGGVSALLALGHTDVAVYHMNEGHSALLSLALLEQKAPHRHLRSATDEDRAAVRQRCVFTTHTPVPAGHDKFPIDLVRSVLGDDRSDALAAAGCYLDSTLNMTHLALVFSRFINGVSMRHEDVSRDMFPEYPINSVTNGVHAVTWTSEPFARLYDRHIPEWRRDSMYLRYAVSIPLEEIRQAHGEAKATLLEVVRQRTGANLRNDILTIGFARRATGYKRADLLFSDTERLKRMAHSIGPLQVIYAGKAHPRDESGKATIRAVYQAAAVLRGDVDVVYLADYDMALAKHICSGVDVWLNTPLRPQEASGTSGMKAALNGVPSLSVLDGWWVEGHIEGVTGWSIGDEWAGDNDRQTEIDSLYGKLEGSIMPVYYQQPEEYAGIMRSAIAINGSYYNAKRMVFQYLANAYSVWTLTDGARGEWG